MTKDEIRRKDRAANAIHKLVCDGFAELPNADKTKVNIAIASLEKAADDLSNLEFAKSDSDEKRMLRSAERYFNKAKQALAGISARDPGVEKAKSAANRINLNGNKVAAENEMRALYKYLSVF